MPAKKIICIISNSHSTNDVRLYHKLGKSLCKIASVYVLGARGIGQMMEHYRDEPSTSGPDKAEVKPTRIIVSGLTPVLKLWGLYRQALKLKPDLVICVEPLTMIVGFKLKKNTGCKLFYDAHEYYTSAHSERYPFPFNHIIGGLYYLFEHYMQEKMDLTIAVNSDIFSLFNLQTPETAEKHKNDAKSTMDKYWTSPLHLGVVCANYPTDAIFKDDLADCGISNLLPNIIFDTIYLGGLSEERGILKLLQVINILRQKRPLFKALFVGPFHSEAFKQKFFAYLMDNNLNSFVYWRDAIPHDKVCAVLKQVKVGLCVLHPGHKRYKKGVSLKVLEYLSVGIPVVANNFPQIKDIIEKHNLGYCVPFHRQDIVNAVEKLLDLSVKDRDVMAEKCREVVKQHYMWTQVEPVLLDAVNYILKQP